MFNVILSMIYTWIAEIDIQYESNSYRVEYVESTLVIFFGRGKNLKMLHYEYSTTKTV